MWPKNLTIKFDFPINLQKSHILAKFGGFFIPENHFGQYSLVFSPMQTQIPRIHPSKPIKSWYRASKTMFEKSGFWPRMVQNRQPSTHICPKKIWMSH